MSLLNPAVDLGMYSGNTNRLEEKSSRGVNHALEKENRIGYLPKAAAAAAPSATFHISTKKDRRQSSATRIRWISLLMRSLSALTWTDSIGFEVTMLTYSIHISQSSHEQMWQRKSYTGLKL
jgi:hypothetical protein